MIKFLENYLHININLDDEEEGYSIDCHEDGNIFSCLIINKNNQSYNKLFLIEEEL